MAALAILLVLAGGTAQAQQPRQQPKQQPKQPAPQPAPPPQAAPQPAQPQIVSLPWTKLCGKDQSNPAAEETCLTLKEAILDTGQFLAGAALIEQQGEEKRLFRATLPLGMQISAGIRVIVDADPPLTGRYVVCMPNGCMADVEVDAAFVAKLKKGQQLLLQGINLSGQVASYPLPLADFAKANEGSATDPNTYQQQQQNLRQQLEQKRQQAPGPGMPTPTPAVPMPAPTR